MCKVFGIVIGRRGAVLFLPRRRQSLSRYRGCAYLSLDMDDANRVDRNGDGVADFISGPHR